VKFVIFNSKWWGAYSAPRPPSWIKGKARREGREEEGKEKRRTGRELR